MPSNARQIPLDLTHRPAYGREDFLVGQANQDAIALLDQWPNWPAPMLVIQGSPASGKSHLAAVWTDRTQAALLNLDDLHTKTAEQIAQTGTHIVLDGLDLWLGDTEAETRLFHLYNLFKEENRTLLVTMRMAPTDITFALPDLASRFRAAPLVAIQPPDDDLLSAVLIKLFHDRQLQVSTETITYILPRMERSFSAARALVNASDQLALSVKSAITIPLMRRVLSGLQS